MSSQSSYSGTLKLVSMLEKKVFMILAVSLPSLIILSFSAKVILSVDKTLSQRNEENVLQNFLLSVMFFSLRLLQ